MLMGLRRYRVLASVCVLAGNGTIGIFARDWGHWIHEDAPEESGCGWCFTGEGKWLQHLVPGPRNSALVTTRQLTGMP